MMRNVIKWLIYLVIILAILVGIVLAIVIYRNNHMGGL